VTQKDESVRIAVIGGSGLYNMKGVEDLDERRIETPFGSTSDAVILGTVAGVRTAFLPRHGRGHYLLPTEVPSKANIWALKSLGVERIISASAVGSLREELAPRHFVFPDQMVDETRHRNSTFFGNGVVAHVAFAHPFSRPQSELLYQEAKSLGLEATHGGTYCCMEGPQFSTRAESNMHRQLGYDIIGMTAAGEAKLAREAEICYSTIAMVTDYDCWKDDDHVHTEKVVEHLMANAENVQKLLKAALPKLAAAPLDPECSEALKGAIFTAPDVRNKETLERLGPIVSKYVETAAA
jgi:5'-methylthioadenosine phosphorylase